MNKLYLDNSERKFITLAMYKRYGIAAFTKFLGIDWEMMCRQIFLKYGYKEVRNNRGVLRFLSPGYELPYEETRPLTEEEKKQQKLTVVFPLRPPRQSWDEHPE